MDIQIRVIRHTTKGEVMKDKELIEEIARLELRVFELKMKIYSSDTYCQDLMDDMIMDLGDTNAKYDVKIDEGPDYKTKRKELMTEFHVAVDDLDMAPELRKMFEESLKRSIDEHLR